MARSRWQLAGGAAVGLVALAILVGERRRPLRRPTQAEPRRHLNNLALGAMSLATVALIERPLTTPLAVRVERRRRGIAQALPAPAWARDAAAVLLMDYSIYLWHVATHKLPFLWRFHLVHHVDLDLDASTALRFHAADMAISTPYRAAQVAILGVSPRALAIWRNWFFLSVLFHHSNVALPPAWERRLARLVTTPRMHGVHHSATREATGSNWSSGLALWDHLHRTFRAEAATDAIGVPAYRDPGEIAIGPSLRMPFRAERDAWAAADTALPVAR